MPEVTVRRRRSRRKTARERVSEWLYENRPQLAVAGAFVIAVAIATACFKLGFRP